MTNDDIKILFDSLREEMRAGHSLTRGTIKAEVDRIDEKVDRVILHQEKQNGTIKSHEDKIVDLEKRDITFQNYQDNCPANKIAIRMQKKWFWVAVGVVFIIAYFLLEALYHSTTLGEIIEKII